MRNPANPSSVRVNNQKLIIEHIRSKGSASRADLSKALSISKPSISTNVDGLIDQGILLEQGSGTSSGGRKPTMLIFNGNYRCILSMDLNRNKPMIALSNLNKEILEVIKIDINIDDQKPLIIEKMTQGMNCLLKEQGFSVDKLGIITIAIPGVIDEETGKIFANPQFNLWSKLNLKSILSEIYNVPVLMKNDISMAALGEKYFGCGKPYKYMAYVSAGLGVGAGIILNNTLYEGPRKAAGEIGYMSLACEEGNLEDQLSTIKLFKKIEDDLNNGVESLLKSKVEKKDISIELINEAIEERDAYAIKIILKLAQMMGSAVANMALVLDLELIVMGGILSDLNPMFLETIKATVKKILPFDIEVKKSDLKSMAGIYGLIELGEGFIVKEMVV